MESDLFQSNVNEKDNLLVDDTVGSIQDQLSSIELRNPGGSSGPQIVVKDSKEEIAVNPNTDNNETLEADNLDIKPKHETDSEIDASDAKVKENISKTVGIGDAEEGELDYEEEVPEEDNRLHTGGHKVDNEEGELTDKDTEGDKHAEGSEEGEIFTDDEDDTDIVSDSRKDKKTVPRKDDAEEGEIEDDDLEEGQLDEEPDRGPRPRVLCKYYEAGTCRWGISCRFLHPGINDKGNYLMHRPVGMYPTAFGKPPPPSELGPLNNMMLRGPPFSAPGPAHLNALIEMEMQSAAQPKKESAWERGLKKAKEIKQTSLKRKEEDENFEEKRLNLTIVENEAESECLPVRREPWRHTLDRDNQVTPRQRPPEQRPDVYDRRFNRGRLSPSRRHELERERPPRGHAVDRERPRDMDRERFLRMRRARSPTPPERKDRDRDRDRDRERERDRDRGREKNETRRDKRPEKVNDKTALPPDGTRSVREKPESSQRGIQKEAGDDPINDMSLVAPVAGNAEQWVDPWMRRQPQPNRSPELRSPDRKPLVDDHLSSIGSSNSEADSESEESDLSGSESDSDSKGSTGSDPYAVNVEKTEERKPELLTKETSGSLRDPRLEMKSSRDGKDESAAPQANRNASHAPEKTRLSKNHRDSDRRRYHEDPRRAQSRSHENERRHRDRRERYPHSPNSSWQGQAPMDSGWSRGGYYPGGGGFRSMPDRMRNQEDESRARMDRHPTGRRDSPRSHRDPPHSRRHTHRGDSKDDKDRKRIERKRSQSPSKRRKSPNITDPRLADPSKERKQEEVERAKENEKKNQVNESMKRPEPRNTKQSNETAEPIKKASTANSDVSEDEFKSPTYAAGSGSESESESGSDSDSESAAASDSGSASGSESSPSESESGSASEDNNSDSSDSDASGSRRKELEKKKKDFKMVLSQTKNFAGSQRISKPQSNTNTKDATDPKSVVGQKRTATAQENSESPRSAPNKTAARKDELLKELKAIEDAIARKRAKID